MADVCLKEYVRKTKVDRNGKRYPVVVGEMWACCDEHGVIQIGFAKWHPGKDAFDKEFMHTVAMERAYAWKNRMKTVNMVTQRKDGTWYLHDTEQFDYYEFPYAIQKALPKFLVRCAKYFKQGNLPEWAATVMDHFHLKTEG